MFNHFSSHKRTVSELSRIANQLILSKITNVRGLRNQRQARVETATRTSSDSEDLGKSEVVHTEDDVKVEDSAKKKPQIFNTVLYKRERQAAYQKYVLDFRNPPKVDPQENEFQLSIIAETLLKETRENFCQINSESSNTQKESNEKVIYPYAIHTPTHNQVKKLSEDNVQALKGRLRKLSSVFPNEAELDSEVTDFDLEIFGKNPYGSADKNIPASKVPCGGCGALLHCQDTGLPGYIPSEIFRGASNAELRALICQRCHFLKDYNIALAVNIAPEEYTKLLSEIKDKVALVVLIVDLLDIPSSIWPGLVEVIGRNRPICVVGNKIDLIPKDKSRYLERIKESLAQTLKDVGLDTGKNIKHISLVSAKTGYGIEELINKLQNHWGLKGDVYLVGCTNVGKSTLFNTLIQSDFCKAQAVDVIQRATVSVWPGTTLNLLKFPILRVTGKRLQKRVQRLTEERKAKNEEEKMRQNLSRATKNFKYSTLISQVGFTFYQPEPFRSGGDPFLINMTPNPGNEVDKRKVFNPKKPEFMDSKWCYDTPGSVQPDQILNILTLDELKVTLPKEIITPRTFAVKPKYSLLLAGLGRIDVQSVESNVTIRLTVFSSPDLPISVIPIDLADKFYKEHLGTEILRVPFGDENRLKDFPPLIGKHIELLGVGWNESCADIILSSAGWVSVTPGHTSCILEAFTPGGKGCFVRTPSMLPFAVGLRGKRIKFTPCYQNDRLPF